VSLQVVGPVDCIVLTRTQYAVILDPVDAEGFGRLCLVRSLLAVVMFCVLRDGVVVVQCDALTLPTGRPQLGKKALKRGPATFFLQPGERLENGTQVCWMMLMRDE
jgi:hypothetical protein